MSITALLLLVFYLYLLVGLLFALWFVFKGVQKLDSGMDGAKWNLRLLLLPGAVLLWPVLIRKYLKNK